MSSDYNPNNKESMCKLIDRMKGTLIKMQQKQYYCKWCKRHILLDNGVYVHDDVHHDENFAFEEGHKLQ